jgi:hypothetical protein
VKHLVSRRRGRFCVTVKPRALPRLAGLGLRGCGLAQGRSRLGSRKSSFRLGAGGLGRLHGWRLAPQVPVRLPCGRRLLAG